MFEAGDEHDKRDALRFRITGPTTVFENFDDGFRGRSRTVYCFHAELRRAICIRCTARLIYDVARVARYDAQASAGVESVVL
jgi:hypothetical protein